MLSHVATSHQPKDKVESTLKCLLGFTFLNVQKCVTLLMYDFYTCDKDLSSLVNRLEHDSLLETELFENNHIKLSQEKCRLLVTGNKHKNIWARIRQTKIWESRKQKPY